MEHTALVRRPSPRLEEGLITHITRTEVDAELAEQQWRDYVAALHGNGWSTVEVPQRADLPDSAFVEDTMVVFENLAVIARPGARARRPEVADAEQTVRDQGYRLAHIEPPGTLEGGDVLKVGRTVYVGQGGRTNDEGFTQLRDHLDPFDVRVVGVPLSKVLHLKSAVTALPDGTVIGYEPLVDDPSVFDTFLPVPEPSGAHVVLLDDTGVLMAASAPETAKLFVDRGLRPVTVDISEFERLEGCVTCLSVRLRG